MLLFLPVCGALSKVLTEPRLQFLALEGLAWDPVTLDGVIQPLASHSIIPRV